MFRVRSRNDTAIIVGRQMNIKTEIKVHIIILWIAVASVVYTIEIKYQAKLSVINERLTILENTK